jgi:hypothetical protein
MSAEDLVSFRPDETRLFCDPDDPTDGTDGGASPQPHAVHPAFSPPPHGIAAIRQVYGDIRIEGGKIMAPARWEEHNMVLVRDLPGVAKLYVHRIIVEPLRALLEVCQRHGYTIHTIGCWNVRPKRTNGEPSAHAFGAAVDINAATNPMVKPGQPLVTDMPAPMVAEIKALGWTWGGDFHDAMHWQWLSGY